MRPGQNKRSRGRNGGGPHHNRPRGGMPHRIQTFDSNGPNVKIRGNAYQVFERYVALAREAQAAGDRVAAENLYQHAEHYFRVMNAQGEGQGHGPPRPMTPADVELGGDGEMRGGEMREREDTQAPMQQPTQVHGPVSRPGGDAEFRREFEDTSRESDRRDDEQPPSY